MDTQVYEAAQRKRVRLPAHGIEVDCFVAGDGPPVVLLHGAGGGAMDWELNFDELAERGFTMIAVDLPGHGASDDPPQQWDLQSGAAFVADLLDSLGLTSAALAGHSAGGLLAAATALEQPERVESIILLAPAGLQRRLGWTLRILTIPVLGGFLMRPSKTAARAAMARIFFDSRLAPRSFIDRWTDRGRDRAQRRTFFRLLREGAGLAGLRRDLVYRSRMQDLAVPALIVWGAEDRIVPMPSDLDGVTETNPGVSVHVIERCGHWPHVEAAETFNAAVADFLVRERPPETRGRR